MMKLGNIVKRGWITRLAMALVVVLIGLGAVIAFVTLQPEVADEWGITNLADELGIVSESMCAVGCQACYCDSIINRTCYVGGSPSGCVGCLGTCTSDEKCECQSGRGGCGARIAWCRDRDCGPRPTPRPTTPPATPTPVPPVCDDGATYVHIEEPFADWFYEPDYPIAIHQDPQFRGFDIVIDANGGFAEKREIKLEQLCSDGSGIFPDDCPAEAWQWSCSDYVLEHYDDPVVKVEMPMRLADSTVEWIEGDLASRYYNATRKEPLPKLFELWEGESMALRTGLYNYEAQDPGNHGGRIIILTKGTPLNEPQRLAIPYSVPVYLLDSTLRE